MSKNAKRLVEPASGKAFEHGKDSVGNYLSLPNGLKHYFLTSAITANTTVTTAAAGCKAETSSATGRASVFVSDGSKWQFLTNA